MNAVGVFVRRLAVKRLTIYPLTLPMKRRVSHATSARAVSEPIVACVELMNGAVGYGETLPRPYVTGETNASVLACLQDEFTKELLAFRPRSFPEALEAIDALPFLTDAGVPCPAARAAVELAMLEASFAGFERRYADAVGWLGLPGFGFPGSRRKVRYSLVLASESVTKIRRRLRLGLLAGMRHFKLKVGFPEHDDARVSAVASILNSKLRRGRATLRLDANGAWTFDRAVEALNLWRATPFAGVEQPLPVGQEDQLPDLRERTGVRVFHDESLVTMADARCLHERGVADGFNIRISKNGGLLAALRLAGFARQHGIALQLGCMVGETSILSGAGVRFLEAVPGVAFCEGAYGSLLMAEDVVRRPIRFGLGGRVPRLGEDGWGVDVIEERLMLACGGDPIVLEL